MSDIFFVYKREMTRQLYQLIKKLKVKHEKVWITDWFATEDLVYTDADATESHPKDPEFNSSLKT